MSLQSLRPRLPRSASQFLAACVALSVLLLPVHGVLARNRLQPRFFALTSAVFPVGSRVVRAGIESNRRLVLDDPTHFGPSPSSLGRLSGYYIDAEERTPNGEATAYTSYLVSVFSSLKQAQAAYEIRWSTWFDATYFTTPASAPISLGDQGDDALFHSLAPHPPLSEFFFRRGPILVEVFQGLDHGSPNAGETQSFLTIATKLDALARVYARRLSKGSPHRAAGNQ